MITTKYPEEIGFAYKVGLIRNGHIFVEDRPEELRQRYNCSTYDQLYQKFCESHAQRRIRPSIAPYLTTGYESVDQYYLDIDQSSTTANSNSSLQPKSQKTSKYSKEFVDLSNIAGYTNDSNGASQRYLQIRNESDKYNHGYLSGTRGFSHGYQQPQQTKLSTNLFPIFDRLDDSSRYSTPGLSGGMSKWPLPMA